jgi:chitin disaccharide deacetylase
MTASKAMLAAWAVFALSVPGLAQEPSGPRLIVRGDDMGAAHSINEAIIECHKNGIQSAIEVIVPSPWFPEAAKMLKEYPTADVGVHLALTSEWDNVKWRPLTDCPSLRNESGYFFPMIQPNRNYPGQALKEHAWKLDEIEKEFRAQIELAKREIPQVNHLSGHMGCSGFDEKVRELTRKLAAEYRLDVEFDPQKIRGVTYQGPKKTADEKIASLIKMLNSLETGKTYLFVDHPGLDTPEMRAIHHIGYEDVAADRQGVTTAWTSSKVKDVIKQKRIQLIGYGKLKDGTK